MNWVRNVQPGVQKPQLCQQPIHVAAVVMMVHQAEMGEMECQVYKVHRVHQVHWDQLEEVEVELLIYDGEAAVALI